MCAVALSELSPKQKAAIVVMTVGPDALDLLKGLGDTVMEQLAGEIVQLGDVPRSIRDAVLAEFYNRLAAMPSKEEGGLEKASQILEASLGRAGASRVVEKIGWKANGNLSRFARRNPPKFAAMLVEEHPQTAAFLITQLDQPVAARVMNAFPEELQPELTWRIATMGEIAPETATAVHNTLAPVVAPAEGTARRTERVGGEQKAAGLLNLVPVKSQKTVLETIASRDHSIAQRLRKLMFVFRDLLLLDDRAIQRTLKELDTKDLSLALKNAAEDIKAKIFKNVSSRAAETIKEEMEYMGPVRASDIEAAQDRIIEAVRALEEKGEIIIERGTGGA